GSAAAARGGDRSPRSRRDRSPLHVRHGPARRESRSYRAGQFYLQCSEEADALFGLAVRVDDRFFDELVETTFGELRHRDWRLRGGETPPEGLRPLEWRELRD